MKRALAFLVTFLLLASTIFASDKPFGDQPRAWGVMEKNGVHWLSTPEGRPFFSKGVNFIDGGKESEKSLRKQAFYWRNFYPSIDDWRRSAGMQLNCWGFNTRGGWSDPSRDIDLALTVDIELGRNSKFHWFDPFDPAMEKTVVEWAEKLTAPFRGDPSLIGYFSDNEVGWWNSALFIWYLSKGWENHTKRFLWQLIYDHYDGDWARLLADWVPQGSIASFENLRSADAALKLRPGGEGIRVVDRFLFLCAQRYYQMMYRAIKEVHPEALVLGDRLPLYYHQDAVLAIGENVDVISTNYNVDVPDGWVAPYYFDGLRALANKPVLVTEFFYAAEENRSGNLNETARSAHPKPGHLMTVQTQADRARGLAGAVANFARFPNIVGVHWFQYCDEPFGGREDGEDYNMGLIDTANAPYEEVTDAFRLLNPKLDVIHQESLNRLPASDGKGLQQVSLGESEKQPVKITRAQKPIDATDQSFMDWNKETTLLTGFQTPKPYVPFGDVHLAWSPEGLYLLSIANTYVDPNFLAYDGEFPLSEAFQIHLVTQAEEKGSHFAIHFIPKRNPQFPDGFEVTPVLYRYKNGKPFEQLSTEGFVQRLNKSLPHMLLEAFFPKELLGIKSLEPGTRLKMNIFMTNYYREHSMIWSGDPTAQNHDHARSMKSVELEGPEAESPDHCPVEAHRTTTIP